MERGFAELLFFPIHIMERGPGGEDNNGVGPRGEGSVCLHRRQPRLNAP